MNTGPAVRDQTQLIRIHRRIAGIHARAGRASQALESRGRHLRSQRGWPIPPRRPRDPEGARHRPSPSPNPATTGNPSEASWRGWACWDRRKLVEAKRPNHPNDLAEGLRRAGIALQKCVRPAEAVSAFRESSGSRGWPTGHPPTATTSFATDRCSPASPPKPALVSRPPRPGRGE